VIVAVDHQSISLNADGCQNTRNTSTRSHSQTLLTTKMSIVKVICFIFQIVCHLFLTGNTNVFSQECAFISGLYDMPGDALIVGVDCRWQPIKLNASVGNLSNTASSLVVQLTGCSTVPDGLFSYITLYFNLTVLPDKVNISADLTTEVLPAHTFVGLENIRELRLHGFTQLLNFSAKAFVPLKRLERLFLVGVGRNIMSYVDLGSAISGLSGTPLTTLVFHQIIAVTNSHLMISIDRLVPLQNVSVKHFVFSDSIVNTIEGRLSVSLPDLTYACIGSDIRHNSANNFILDSLIVHQNVEELIYYTYPKRFTGPVSADGNYQPNLLKALNPDVIGALVKYPFRGCYWDVKVPISRQIKRIVCHTASFLESTIVNTTLCIHEDNSLESVDFAGTPFPEALPYLTGFGNTRYFNLQDTSIQRLPMDFFKYFPQLRVLLLSRLQIKDDIQRADSSFFGFCPFLEVLDLSACDLSSLPKDLFSRLNSLAQLNLSGNSLQVFDTSLENNFNLTLLNLSSNSIGVLSSDTIRNLTHIAELRLNEGSRLTVDLSNNLLNCLCNSTESTEWLVTSHESDIVLFHRFETYKCLYPDGSNRQLQDLNITDLFSRCSILQRIVNNDDCPCDEATWSQYMLVHFYLENYWCRDENYKLTSMKTDCPTGPHCRNAYRSVQFIAPMAIGGFLVSILVISLIVLYRYRRTQPVKDMLECIGFENVSSLFRQLLSLMDNRREHFTHDVFLYCHIEDDRVQLAISDKLIAADREVLTQDHWIPGVCVIDALQECTRSCRWIVPVLTTRSATDPHFVFYIDYVLLHRPRALVPIVWHTDMDVDKSDDTGSLLRLVKVADPLHWPGDGDKELINVEKSLFWNNLLVRTRINFDVTKVNTAATAVV
jgi:Leucine-rich repeat (LRR) protein